jgi:hypothetical protein
MSAAYRQITNSRRRKHLFFPLTSTDVVAASTPFQMASPALDVIVFGRDESVKSGADSIFRKDRRESLGLASYLGRNIVAGFIKGPLLRDGANSP